MPDSKYFRFVIECSLLCFLNPLKNVKIILSLNLCESQPNAEFAPEIQITLSCPNNTALYDSVGFVLLVWYLLYKGSANCSLRAICMQLFGYLPSHKFATPGSANPVIHNNLKII